MLKAYSMKGFEVQFQILAFVHELEERLELTGFLVTTTLIVPLVEDVLMKDNSWWLCGLIGFNFGRLSIGRIWEVENICHFTSEFIHRMIYH